MQWMLFTSSNDTFGIFKQLMHNLHPLVRQECDSKCAFTSFHDVEWVKRGSTRMQQKFQRVIYVIYLFFYLFSVQTYFIPFLIEYHIQMEVISVLKYVLVYGGSFETEMQWTW